jgi:hypothetical protein
MGMGTVGKAEGPAWGVPDARSGEPKGTVAAGGVWGTAGEWGVTDVTIGAFGAIVGFVAIVAIVGFRRGLGGSMKTKIEMSSSSSFLLLPSVPSPLPPPSLSFPLTSPKFVLSFS